MLGMLIRNLRTDAQIVNILGIGLVKISVCLCVLRVIDKVGKMRSRFLYILIAFVSASHLAQVSEDLDIIVPPGLY